ncbi:MAG: anti-sigma factor family protein [Planctomycetota bacterium]|jgi:predicted anti-sigma-YlaC factor YlaD
MNCEDVQPLITGALDDELSAQQQQDLDAHLASCESCRGDLEELKELKESLAMIQFTEPGDAELEKYWGGIYNRLERGVGWILFSAGAIVLLSYGSFKLIEEVIKDPTISWAVKIGLSALMAGTVIVFVSLLRERLTIRKTDKYSREVQR